MGGGTQTALNVHIGVGAVAVSSKSAEQICQLGGPGARKIFSEAKCGNLDRSLIFVRPLRAVAPPLGATYGGAGALLPKIYGQFSNFWAACQLMGMLSLAKNSLLGPKIVSCPLIGGGIPPPPHLLCL